MTMSIPSTSRSSVARVLCGRASATPTQHHGGQAQHRRQIAQPGDQPGRSRAELRRARVHEQRRAGRARAAAPPRAPAPPPAGSAPARTGARSGSPPRCAAARRKPGGQRHEDQPRSARRGCARRGARGARLAPRSAAVRHAAPPVAAGGAAAAGRHRPRRGDDPDRALQRAARLGGRRRDLGELHQVARRQPALDLAQQQLAPGPRAAARRPARRWSSPANRSRNARPGTRG